MLITSLLAPQNSLIKLSTLVSSLKMKKAEKEKMLLVLGGVLAFLLLLSGGGKMKSISYNPSKDELGLEIRPFKGKPSKQFERYKFWWDKEGNFCGIYIMQFMEELEEFRKDLNTVRLGGIWKGIKISEKDIKETREDLLNKLEGKW